MSAINVVAEDVQLDAPTVVEGLPGLGLVGKIATDHLVDTFDMTYYAGFDCEGLPRISVYSGDDRTLRPPVRLYADEQRDLVALVSDVPVSAEAAPQFASCTVQWMQDNDATPLFLSGLPHQKEADQVPELYGVATGEGGDLLDDQDVGVPPEAGAIGGPTGALLNRAARDDLDAVGLIVQSDPQFPDPEAARALIKNGIAPVGGFDVDTDELVERAEEIREQKERLAQRMQQVETKESSQAQPLRMYQ
ncbi:proteasome assembly chaperone family protein [Halomicrococcus gelatinilyticus]|uniref:proteasome assembly chaperone family protein n=1 Tax=Halomicrococcus gelatinilyticus TaxID=1702103 RepID=UPI002E124065